MPSRPGATLLVAVLVTAALSAGCAGGGNDVADAPTTTGAAAGVDFLRDPVAARTALRRRFGEAPSLRRLSLGPRSITLELRDAAKPENVDSYSYDPAAGTWRSSPVRMSMSDIEELDRVTFTPGSIAWDRIPGLIRQALDGLDLEGEEVTSVSVDRIDGDPPRIYIGVNGLRGDGRLLAGADGTGVDIARN